MKILFPNFEFECYISTPFIKILSSKFVLTSKKKTYTITFYKRFSSELISFSLSNLYHKNTLKRRFTFIHFFFLYSCYIFLFTSLISNIQVLIISYFLYNMRPLSYSLHKSNPYYFMIISFNNSFG